MEKPDYKEVEIEEYDGPYINEYLRGMTPGPNGNKFKTLDEAVNAANRNKYCRGVTLTRQGIFTLRSGKVLKPSDKNNRFKNIEITWVKKNLVDDISFSAKSRWPLDNKAPYMKGPGLKL